MRRRMRRGFGGPEMLTLRLSGAKWPDMQPERVASSRIAAREVLLKGKYLCGGSASEKKKQLCIHFKEKVLCVSRSDVDSKCTQTQFGISEWLTRLTER